ncbi:lamin tail domain-containing protein [Myxococcota bacterium]|nr:lamin tail domain-containing protein [Myxococcota bacterium]
MRFVTSALLAGALGSLVAQSALAALIVSEVHPSGSGNGLYGADFFELTNTGSSSIDITGWRIDDNSNSFGSAVALRGVTSIGAGQSVIFIEGDATGSNDAALRTSFLSSWFGSNPPVGIVVGGYGGSGVGLSTAGDAVNVFDASGARITGIAFGTATAGRTFDNAAGLGSTTLPLPVVSTLSVSGVNGAFVSPAGETGSPGIVPEPGTATLMGLGMGLLAARSRRSAKN